MTVAHTEEGERTVSQSPTGNRAAATERAILAGGCFWGMEDLLRRARGVISTRVGYTGGEMPDPTYARHYGHAEAVEVTFDPSVLAYRSWNSSSRYMTPRPTSNKAAMSVRAIDRRFSTPPKCRRKSPSQPSRKSRHQEAGQARSCRRSTQKNPFGRRSQSTKNTWCAILGAIAATSCARPGGWTAQTNAQL